MQVAYTTTKRRCLERNYNITGRPGKRWIPVSLLKVAVSATYNPKFSILHVDRDISYLAWASLMFSSVSMFKYTRMLSLQVFEIHQTRSPYLSIRHLITFRCATLSLNILETIQDNTVFYETISNLDYISSNIWVSDKRFLERILKQSCSLRAIIPLVALGYWQEPRETSGRISDD